MRTLARVAVALAAILIEAFADRSGLGRGLGGNGALRNCGTGCRGRRRHYLGCRCCHRRSRCHDFRHGRYCCRSSRSRRWCRSELRRCTKTQHHERAGRCRYTHPPGQFLVHGSHLHRLMPGKPIGQNNGQKHGYAMNTCSQPACCQRRNSWRFQSRRPRSDSIVRERHRWQGTRVAQIALAIAVGIGELQVQVKNCNEINDNGRAAGWRPVSAGNPAAAPCRHHGGQRKTSGKGRQRIDSLEVNCGRAAGKGCGKNCAGWPGRCQKEAGKLKRLS